MSALVSRAPQLPRPALARSSVRRSAIRLNDAAAVLIAVDVDNVLPVALAGQRELLLPAVAELQVRLLGAGLPW